METVNGPTDRGAGAISILARREIEARIVGPIIEAMSHEFGRERVIAVVRETILKLARETGAGLAQHSGGCSLAHFANTLTLWRADDALDIDMIESTQETLSFNVTRCRYAEMYEALGLRELGGILSCSRDYALIEGFNPSVQLTRTQTIMEGATHCDFRFADKSSIAGASSKGNET